MSSKPSNSSTDEPMSDINRKSAVKFNEESKEGTTGKKGEKGDLTHEYKKGEAQVSAELEKQLKAFFDKMDFDGDGKVTQTEAEKHFKKFPKVSAQSMFNEVDEDGNKEVSWDEFFEFWKNVVASGYSTEDLMEEVGDMINGESWVDFNDGRTT
jgi:hypothetical protein